MGYSEKKIAESQVVIGSSSTDFFIVIGDKLALLLAKQR